MPGSDDASEADLVARLRAGDERAFGELVYRYHASMVRVASTYVPSRAVAEEVVQDTWLGVLRGLDRFEGRSTLKTWIFRILLNRARTTGAREPRSVTLDDADAGGEERFGPDGGWRDPPVPFTDEIENRLAAPEMAARVREAVDELPEAQRRIVTLRDIEGLSGAEVCELLDISDGNQRVILHRGRARVRAMLEDDVKKWVL